MVFKVVDNLLFADHVRDLGCLSEEVEILADSSPCSGAYFSTSTKGIIVEVVTCLIELICQSVVGIFEVKAKFEDMSASGTQL